MPKTPYQVLLAKLTEIIEQPKYNANGELSPVEMAYYIGYAEGWINAQGGLSACGPMAVYALSHFRLTLSGHEAWPHHTPAYRCAQQAKKG